MIGFVFWGDWRAMSTVYLFLEPNFENNLNDIIFKVYKKCFFALKYRNLLRKNHQVVSKAHKTIESVP